MSTYEMDGIVYNERPKSRVEKLLIDIYNKITGGGGGGEIDVNIGNGIKVVGNTLMMDTTSTIETGNIKPASSDGLQKQFDKAEMILNRV